MIEEKLRQLIEPIIFENNLELVDLQFRRESTGWVLRLVIDKEAGVSIDDCADISRETGRILEVEDLIDHAYNLEVSSPGLDRPLKTEKDFIRFQGRKTKVKLKEPIDNQWGYTGTLAAVKDGQITLTTQSGDIHLSLEAISQARLVIDI